jgi:hypothetical protein
MIGKARDGPDPVPVREVELAPTLGGGRMAWRDAVHAFRRDLSLDFRGRRTGGPGPDFRDAALETEDGARLLGDIKLHLRARDWLAHGHHIDKRYNRVVLHVALDTTSSSSPLASGGNVPVVCLDFSTFSQSVIQAPSDWPCTNLQAHVGPVALRTLLLWAGTERFERRLLDRA